MIKHAIFAALGVLVLAFLVIGALAPRDFRVEREVVIAKPRAEVFDYLTHFKSQGEWTTFNDLDPAAEHTYLGQDATVGFVSRWSGNQKMGAGQQTITALEPGKRIDFMLEFERPFRDTSTGFFETLDEGPGQTRVRWAMLGKSPFPINVLCYLMNMRGKLARDFDQSLAKLKARLEK